jgi:hypothetical protein
MNLRRQLFWYQVLTAMYPRKSAQRKRWREKKQRLRELLKLRQEIAVWDGRTADVLACPDLAALPRHPQGGAVIGEDQVMHNGLRVALGSYYTPRIRQLLRASEGVHEPQEERVFAEVLKQMPAGAVMLELGAYWAFYSMWFQQAVAGARNVMVEPERANLNIGRLNFATNGFKGEFFQAFLGDQYDPVLFSAPVVSVDWLAEKFQLERINLLHCDIQGHESAMLRGAAKMLRERRIDYVFVSTHEGQHEACRAALLGHDYVLLAEHTIAESYSVDGLLVARRRELAGMEPVGISKKRGW